MKISLGAKTAVGGILLLLCLVIAGMYVEQERFSQTNSRRAVIHTYQVLNQLREVAIVSREAAAGQRGFVLTGEPLYLENFQKAKDRLAKTLGQLKMLVSLNPEQQNRLGGLELLTAEKFAELEETIKVRQERGADAAIADWRSKQSKLSGREIYRSIGDMIEAEEASLLERERILDQRTSGIATASLFFVFTCLVAVVATSFLLYRFLSDRRRAELKLAENARLALLNASISRCLSEAESLDEMMQRCADSFVRYLDVSLARIWVKRAGSDELELVASAGISSRLNGELTRLDTKSGVIGKIFNEKRPVTLAIGEAQITDWQPMHSPQDAGSNSMQAARDADAQSEQSSQDAGAQSLTFVEPQFNSVPFSPGIASALKSAPTDTTTTTVTATAAAAATTLSLSAVDLAILKRDGIVAFCGYPLVVDGVVQGLIALFSRQEFEAQTVESLTSLAENVAVGYCRNIVSDSLRKNESALASVFDSAVVGIDWVDAEGKILRVNEAELSFLGYDRNEFVGHNIAEFHEDNSALARMVSLLSRGEAVRNFQARLRGKDGSSKHVIIDSNAYFENGKFMHTRSFVRDVSVERKYELALLEKEARTRTLLETAPDGIVIFKADGTIESGNRVLAKLFGWAARDLPGINLGRLIPQLGSPAFLQEGLQALPGDQASTKPQEFAGLCADGHSLPVEVVWSQVNRRSDGLLIAVVRDISERKANEARLLVQQSVARVLNEAKTVEEASQRILAAICDLTGWSLGAMWALSEADALLHSMEVYGQPWLRDGEMIAMTRAMTFKPGQGLLGRVWESGQPQWFEVLRLDGNFLRAQPALHDGVQSWCAFPVKSGDEVLAVFEFFCDQPRVRDEALLQMMETICGQVALFMERKIFEKRIIESERKFKAIFDHTFQFIGLLSADGTLIEANRTALEFVGCTREEVIGKHFADTPWWSHDPVLQEKLRKALQDAGTGKFLRFEVTHMNLAGRLVTADFTLKPVFDEQGLVTLIIPEGRDISESKEAERRVSEFYSTVSHELRTPLTSIRGSLGLMLGGLAGALPEKALMLVKIASAEADRLIRLINDILDVRKIEAGMLDLK